MLRARLAAVLLLMLGAARCSGDEPDPEPEAASSTPLSALDTGSLTAARAEFCSRITPTAVDEALGSPASRTVDYANGEKARLAPGVTDVAHEYGCVWVGADGTTARAWVFAPPVTAGQARKLRSEATRAEGCAPVPDAAPFGAPTAAVRCTGDDAVVTAYHGLFGDAWLSCSLSTRTETDDLPDRSDRWCAAVVRATG